MSVTNTKGSPISRPATTPIPSTVLDHATVVENENFGLVNDEGLWPSYNCLDTLVPTALCPDPLLDGLKTFGFNSWIPGFTFVYHGGAQCRAVGLDRDDQKSEVKRVFDENEGKGVERALLGVRFVANEESDSPVQWDDPTDITPDCPVTLAQAFALLEGYARSIYAGVPTLHIPAAAGSLLNERLVWTDGKAFTRLGSKVAMGGGYDDIEDLQTGLWDLYATGEVYVERGPENSVNAFTVPGDGSGVGSDENGLGSNTEVALTERMYRVGVDCFVAKVTATVWDCDGSI